MTSIAVLGYSNTGKTTFIEHLTAIAAEAGIRTAILKYGTHPGDFDYTGSDTERFGRTSARIVGYHSEDRWILSIREEITQPRRDGTATAPPVERIPSWMTAVLESADLLILEGRRLVESYVVLCAGTATSPEELKYTPRSADLVIATDPRLIAALSGFAPDPLNKHNPAVTENPRDAAIRCIDIIQHGGKR